MRLPKKKKGDLKIDLKKKLTSDEEIVLNPDVVPPGLRQQLEAGAVPLYTPPTNLTAEELAKMVEDIYFANRPKEPRKVVIGRYCKTYGYIMNDATVISNHCSDPECFHCNAFHEALAEEAKKFISDE